MDLEQLLNALEQRLPELEWKLDGLGNAFNVKALPKGLFKVENSDNPRMLLAEIKGNLQAIRNRQDNSATQFIANRIHQKINVLVTLCHMQNRRQVLEKSPSYRIDRMITRQQWLQSLEAEINVLENQLEALLKKSLSNISVDSTMTLNLQAEIGELEKRLTLARETYDKAL